MSQEGAADNKPRVRLIFANYSDGSAAKSPEIVVDVNSTTGEQLVRTIRAEHWPQETEPNPFDWKPSSAAHKVRLIACGREIVPDMNLSSFQIGPGIPLPVTVAVVWKHDAAPAPAAINAPPIRGPNGAGGATGGATGSGGNGGRGNNAGQSGGACCVIM